MLLEDVAPLHYKFSVADLHFRAEDFDDKYILLSVKDNGGLEVGSVTITFDDDGSNVNIKDEKPGTLDRLRRSGETDTISRQIKKLVKSTL